MDVSLEEWQAFKKWARTSLRDLSFKVNFMTGSESKATFGPEVVPFRTREEREEINQYTRDENARRRAELLAFAEKLGCNIYLAAYLLHLRDDLDYVAAAFSRYDLANDDDLAKCKTTQKEEAGDMYFEGMQPQRSWGDWGE